MFFTITAVENIVVDLDSFKKSPALFDAVLDVLQAKQLNVALVSGSDAGGLTTRGLPILSPAGWTELVMFQNVIRRAVIGLGGKTSRTVFIAADSSLLRNASELLLGTVVVRRPDLSVQENIEICVNFPDFILDTVGTLEQALSGELIGYGGEYFAAPQPAVFQSRNVKVVQYPGVPNEEHPDCPVHLAGRYFGAEDPRHNLHALSMRIVHSKRKPEIQAETFAKTYAHGIEAVTNGQFDCITCVPPRPDMANRLEHFLKALPQAFGSRAVVINPDLIKCVRNYPDLKKLNRAERKAAIEGAFAVQEDLRNKTVVLLDDVRTTGSTMDEAIRALKVAGAFKIIPFVLGYHPFAVKTIALTDNEELHCDKPSCKKALVPRVNNRTGEPFYGCSGWTAADSTGHTTKEFTAAVSAKLGRFELKVLQADAELASGEVDF